MFSKKQRDQRISDLDIIKGHNVAIADKMATGMANIMSVRLSRYNEEILWKKIKQFLGSAEIPKVSYRPNTLLTSSIPATDVKEPIRTMKHHKAPGIEGYCCDFYKDY